MRSRAALAFVSLVMATTVACEEILAEVTAPPEEERAARRPRSRSRTRNRAQSPQPQVPYQQQPQFQQTPGITVPQSMGAIANRLRVTFVDVGQGDAALLETADGHSALIDAGPPEGDEHLRAVLAQKGIRSLDWMLLTHPHLDHIGGARNVLGAVRVQRVIDPAYPHPIATYDRLLAAIQQQAIPFMQARQGQTLALGSSVSVEVLQPRIPFIERSRSEANANSIVTRVTAGAVRVLFTGDAETETEERLLAENRAQLSADILKVAHHGSRYASTQPFLSAVSPRVAVISCGTGNDYGHPHAETLGALARNNVQVYRTDLNGDVEMSTDGARYQFRTTMWRTSAAPR
ncbi:MAG: ComEC/Rec2 family competence protein [Polyangiales bacterium]